MLLQIYTAPPDPTSPQWTILAPIFSKIDLAELKSASLGAPTINVKVPADAALTPPEIQNLKNG